MLSGDEAKGAKPDGAAAREASGHEGLDAGPGGRTAGQAPGDAPAARAKGGRATTLDKVELGDEVVITTVGGEGALRRHFLDMGVLPGARIEFEKYAPMGDPMEFRIHGYELTLRVADAAKIGVSYDLGAFPDASSASGLQAGASSAGGATSGAPTSASAGGDVEHPGLGEGGRYHVKATEHPLPEGTTLTFALAGNQNCGKTTLFNQLTGSNQHVGNFPGVTVDRKDGAIIGHANTDVVDLPGIYSMSPYTQEEVVSRQFILEERPQGIIDIVDATNIERNLYLTMQLMELDVPMVLAVNMMDELQGNGGSARINEMEEMLGIPVVPISAVKGEGVDELVAHALHVAKYQERPGRQDFCDPDDHGGAVHRCLHAIMHLIEDHAARAGIPLRFAATKLVEGDEMVEAALRLDENEREMIEHICVQMEQERGLDRTAAIADMRFSFIERVVAATVVKPHESRERERSRRIDRVLTGRFTAIPAFVAIMLLIFLITFNWLGPLLQDLMQLLIDWASDRTAAGLAAIGASDWVQSLVVDGICNGIGTVLLFMPIIVLMFFFLSLLEDTGYMARVAFVMDKLLRRIGLSGRSIVPMLTGFGCTVPAVMSTRTLPSERDRKLTILITPFMSCATKLTIYAFLTSAFFPGRGGVIMLCLYLLGIALAVLTAWVLQKTAFRGEAVPFVMELPNYRMPSAKSVGRLVWDKTKDFLTRAFTVIFLATLVVWFLQSFSPQLNWTTDPSASILAVVAGAIAPVFAPLGFGDWRISTALIAGFMAKETVVSTLSVLFGGTEALVAAITPLSAMCLLVFCLLYTPCIAAIAAIKRELGGKYALVVIVFQCVVAWVVAFVVRLVGLALGFA
ncbi:MAG: ferrous iron transport protein B [Coriobacteriales bacterium]|jgi:ferrous iron transport protein B